MPSALQDKSKAFALQIIKVCNEKSVSFMQTKTMTYRFSYGGSLAPYVFAR